MDAGLAAIVGAGIGAGASTTVAVIDRIFAARARRADRATADRDELRDALLEVVDALSNLLGGTTDTATHADDMLKANLAMARLDFLLPKDDAPLVMLAIATGTLAARRDTKRTAAVSAFSALTPRWFRHQETTQQVVEQWRKDTGVAFGPRGEILDLESRPHD